MKSTKILLLLFFVTSLFVFSFPDYAACSQMTAGGYHTVGLKSDGSVAATGDNAYGQCDVSEWDLGGSEGQSTTSWIPLLLSD